MDDMLMNLWLMTPLTEALNVKQENVQHMTHNT